MSYLITNISGNIKLFAWSSESSKRVKCSTYFQSIIQHFTFLLFRAYIKNVKLQNDGNTVVT